MAYCGQFLVVRDCGLLWTVFSGDRGTVAYCGQFLVVRDCGLLWTVFSGEGLWLTVDSF